MSLDFSDGSGDFDAGGVMLDKDLQNFILQEQQVAQFNAQVNGDHNLISSFTLINTIYVFLSGSDFQVHKLTEHCWDKCVNDKLTSRFDGKTETCITNCVERFIDASVVIAQRFSSKIMSSAK